MSKPREGAVAKALFRYPHQKRYCRVAQLSGLPSELVSCAAIGSSPAFVVAPFAPSADRPIVLIRPDVVEWADVPVADAASCDCFGDCSTGGFNVSVVNGDIERRRYGVDFRNFHSQLRQGQFAKIVLARCSRMVADRDVEAEAEWLFLRACLLYPRMFIVLVSAPRCGTWLMATPEILLQSDGSGRWRTMALAGTMRLDNCNADFDTPGSLTSPSDIVWSEKNRFEQRYVADYIEECVEQFTDDIESSGPYTTRAGNLVHLRTDFCFSLPDGQPIGGVINALHPTPAVCGMPKADTFNFVMDNEQSPRNYYSGFVGPMNIEGRTSLFVSLRCMNISGRNLSLYAGGGLLADSREEDEWNETEAKMETMRDVLGKVKR